MATGLLGIALSGLAAAQAGISTTQHNISNINTAGFRRQEVDFSARNANLFSSSYYGSGVGVSTIRNLYSQFQDSQVLLNQAQLSRNQAFAGQASQIDELAGDADSGLTSALDAFFSASQTVASDPTSNAARQVMLSSGRNLAARFNNLATAFGDMRIDSNREVAATVGRINTLTSQIADLSGNIARAEGTTGADQPANDLRDQRDHLVSELNKLINVSPVQQTDGAFNLYVGSGQPLLVGTSAIRMSSISDPTNPEFSVPALNLPGGITLPLDSALINGGSLGGLLAARDTVLRPAMEDLDTLAFELATRFNAQHQLGFDKTGTTGDFFFADLSILAAPPANAATAFAMHANMTNPNLIAASATPTGSPGDNTNALLLAELQIQPNTVNGSDTFSSAYAQLVARTATLASEADINVAAYETLTRLSVQAQQSVSGVNLDEEAANLIRFQQAYQASAKAMQIASTLFDELLGVLR